MFICTTIKLIVIISAFYIKSQAIFIIFVLQQYIRTNCLLFPLYNCIIIKKIPKTNESKFIDKTIKNWLKDLDMDTRQQVIDIVFEILNSTNSKTIQDLKFSLVKNARIILSSYKQITPENKKMIEATVTALLGIVKENVKAEYKKFKILSK